MKTLTAFEKCIYYKYFSLCVMAMAAYAFDMLWWRVAFVNRFQLLSIIHSWIGISIRLN